MESIKYSDQQKDGSFRHYVVFGDIAPWDAPPDKCVECATEEDADKLLDLLPCSLMGRVAELEAMLNAALDDDWEQPDLAAYRVMRSGWKPE